MGSKKDGIVRGENQKENGKSRKDGEVRIVLVTCRDIRTERHTASEEKGFSMFSKTSTTRQPPGGVGVWVQGEKKKKKRGGGRGGSSVLVAAAERKKNKISPGTKNICDRRDYNSQRAPDNAGTHLHVNENVRLWGHEKTFREEKGGRGGEP